MPTRIAIGQLRVASASNACGLFHGQNMQCDWDAHAPATSLLGGLLGDYDVYRIGSARGFVSAPRLQDSFDNDMKENQSPISMRAR